MVYGILQLMPTQSGMQPISIYGKPLQRQPCRKNIVKCTYRGKAPSLFRVRRAGSATHSPEQNGRSPERAAAGVRPKAVKDDWLARSGSLAPPLQFAAACSVRGCPTT